MNQAIVTQGRVAYSGRLKLLIVALLAIIAVAAAPAIYADTTQPEPAPVSVDNASGGIIISVADAQITEDNGYFGYSGPRYMIFKVVMSGSPNAPVTLTANAVSPPSHSANPSKAKDARPRDFTGFRGRHLTWQAGATGDALVKNVKVKIFGDCVIEEDETFVMRLNHLSTTDDRVSFAGGGRKIDAVGTIKNDDVPADFLSGVCIY